MTINLKTKISISLGVVLILCLVLGIIAVRSLQQLIDADNEVDRTYQIIDQAKVVKTAAIDMETGARGFLLAGKEAFLQPYLQGVETFEQHIEQLQIKVSDNPAQVRRLQNAEEIIQAWREDWIEVQLKLRRHIGDGKSMNDMAKEIVKVHGKTYFDKFRQQIRTFINREQILLDQRSKKFETVIQSSREHVKVLDESNHWVAHTHEAIIDSKSILIHAIDMETGFRGFLLSGDEEFLQPYHEGRQAFFSKLKALQIKVSDNPAQVDRLTQIESIVQIWMDNVVTTGLALRHAVNDGEKQLNEINQFVAKKQGKQYFDNFRAQIAVFIQAEQNLLIQRAERTDAVLAENKQNIQYIEQNDHWVEHTYIVISQADHLLTAAIDMETGMHGFLLSGTESFLEPYIQGKQAFKQSLSELKQSVSDNPSQMILLDEMADTLTAWKAEVVEPLISLRRQIGDSETMDDMADLVKTGKGKQYFDQFREEMAAFTAEEQRLVDIRREKSLALAAISIDSLFWGTAILLLLAVGIGSYIIREILYQVGGEPAEISRLTAQVAQGNLNLQLENTKKTVGIHASVQQMVFELRSMLNETGQILKQLANGDMDVKVTGKYAGDFIHLKTALESTASQLAQAKSQNTTQDWLKTGQTELSNNISGEQEIHILAKNIIGFVTQYLDAQVGVFYLAVDKVSEQDNIALRLIASYSYTHRKNFSNEYKLGEGVVGQAALEKQTIVIKQVPDSYMQIESGLGNEKPANIVVLPFVYEDEVRGVIEIGSFYKFTAVQLEWLNQIMPMVAVAVNTAESRTKMQVLLQQSQAQAEELQSQSEELQSQSEELQSQQEELRQTNEELEQRTKDLEQQKYEIHKKNEVLEKSQVEIEAKAQELEAASKYKSEFLANMSHELRTPLNSMLILAQLLADNKPQNLTQKQIESARTICASGADLLSLINDILDLSKVEAGKIEVNLEQMRLSEFAINLKSQFQPMAENSGLQFHISIDPQLPEIVRTDAQRFRQIIINLLSNAFKFTEHGSIKVNIYNPTDSDFLRQHKLPAQNMVAVSVADSGVGIPEDKQKLIFEAFQQADGSTSRRFGGTGLGLSISRQLARLLGGEIQLHSELNQGSTFTLYIPNQSDSDTTSEQAVPSVEKALPVEVPLETATAKALPQDQPSIQDDRDQLHGNDRVILIIEDDRNFSNILMELSREKDFKCIVAEDGHTGLDMAKQYKPHAIILDVGLPNVDGFTVMGRLKTDIETRHIPVHFVSGTEQGNDARRMGAIGYLLKPVSMGELGDAFRKIEHFIDKDIRTIMVIVDQKEHGTKILDIVGGESVESLIANQVDEATDILNQTECDCIVLDIDVEQGNGLGLLDNLAGNENLRRIPVILYAERELNELEEQQLAKFENALTVKAVRSPERLLDETTLFLHQIEEKLPEQKRQMLQMVHNKEAILKGKKVLVVDDDTRNIFALATVLEDKEMEVVVAMNGKEALQILDKDYSISLVLMDIMMPEMDGYEAMQQIRTQVRFRKLPIIALTAKAMKGDKAKCIEAGANDYLSKPVDTDKLMSLMRVWLYR